MVIIVTNCKSRFDLVFVYIFIYSYFDIFVLLILFKIIMVLYENFSFYDRIIVPLIGVDYPDTMI